MRLNIKSDFLRNTLTLMTGTTIAQAIPIIATPILTRIYLPEEYGLTGIYLSISVLLGTFSTMSYSSAILLPEKEDDALSILQLCVLSSFLWGIISFMGLFFLNDKIALWMNAPEVTPYLYLVPLSIISTGIGNAFTVWANRFNLYRAIGISRIISSIITLFLSICIGLLIKGPFGLFTGMIMGQLFSPFILILQTYSRNKGIFKFYPGNVLWKTAVNYKNFPKYTLWSDFINSFVNQIPVYMISIYSGKSEVGHYNLSNRMLGMPIGFISTSIGQVFSNKASVEYNKNNNCRELFIKTFKLLFFFSFIPFMIIILFAPIIFKVFFGTEWEEAGVYSQIMGAMFFFKFTVSPLSYLFYIAGKQREDLLWHIVMVLMTFLSFYVGNVLFGSVRSMLLLFTINFSFLYIIYLYRSYSFSKGIRE